jgi:hypothetical protein
MTHLAIVEVDDEGNSATWGEHVTDEEHKRRASVMTGSPVDRGESRLGSSVRKRLSELPTAEADRPQS